MRALHTPGLLDPQMVPPESRKGVVKCHLQRGRGYSHVPEDKPLHTCLLPGEANKLTKSQFNHITLSQNVPTFPKTRLENVSFLHIKITVFSYGYMQEYNTFTFLK